MSHWQFQPSTDAAPFQGPQEMTCPRCNRAMTKGSVGLEYTWWGFFLAGWSLLTLFFRAPGRDRLSIVGLSDTKAAFRRDSCGTIVLVGEGQPTLHVFHAALRTRWCDYLPVMRLELRAVNPDFGHRMTIAATPSD